jgi:gliding motility-associated-like protein
VYLDRFLVMRGWLLFSFYVIYSSGIAQTRINNLFVNSTENILRLDFSKTDPIFSYTGFGSGASIGEGIAHIENDKGQVIILVNSSGIYDLNGNQMPGSTGILAHPSSTEIVICRKPLSSNLFFVIYNNQLCSSLFYSVVDINKRNGLGDVIELNKSLDDKSQYAEGLEIVKVPCSNNFLLLAYQCYSGFVKFEITPEGFSIPQVIYRMTANPFGGRGELDYRKGKLGYGMTFSNKAFLADFDPSTGTVDNPRTISFGATNGIYGLEFSADASRMYVTDLDNRNLFGQAISPNLFCYVVSTGAILSWTLSNQSNCVGSNPQGLGQIEIGKDLNLYVPVIGACKMFVVRQADSNPVIDQIETTSVLSAGISDHIKSEFLDEFILDEPVISSSKRNLILCRNESIKLETTSDPNGSYQWYLNKVRLPNQTSNSIMVSEAGEYYVQVKNRNECAQSSSILTILKSPLLPIDLGRDTILCQNSSIKVSVDGSGGAISWNDNDTLSLKTFDKSGNYSVMVSKDGCIEYDSIQIRVLTSLDNALPNVITPNGDPFNEYFHIPMEWPTPVGLRIFNRWGQEVYANPSYQNEWNGKSLSTGVYYYQINSSYQCLNNLRGWIQVLR